MEHFAEYRLSRSVLWAVLLAVVPGLLALVLTSGGEPLLIVAAVVAVGVFLVRAWSSATVATPEHLVLRGLLRTRTVPWSAIQEIRVEAYPGAAFNKRAPAQVAVFYDRSGRSTTLANLTDRNLAAHGQNLATEVERLRRLWLQRRGPDWKPTPEAQRRAAYQQRHGAGPWYVGLMAAAIAIPVTVVLLLIGLFDGAADAGPPLSWLFGPPAMLIVPALTFAVATAVTARRRSSA